MQNTPMGCGNDLPIFLRNMFFHEFRQQFQLLADWPPATVCNEIGMFLMEHIAPLHKTVVQQ